MSYVGGHNNNGQLGDSSATDRNKPVETVADSYHPNINFTQITVGNYHTCGLDSNSELLCWGSRGYYRIANPSPLVIQLIQIYLRPNLRFYGKELATVSAGGQHTCAIRYDATTWCWGMGNYGQIGDGGQYSSGTMPKMVEFPNNLSAVSLSLGYMNTCAIVDNGEVYCWGRNDLGQLGIGKHNRPILSNTGSFRRQNRYCN